KAGSVDQHQAGQRGRVPAGPFDGEGAAEVMDDQVRPLHAELIQAAVEEFGVAADRVVEAGRLVCPSEARQPGCHGPGDLARMTQQPAPVLRRTRVTVNEDGRLVSFGGPRLEHWRADAV